MRLTTGYGKLIKFPNACVKITGTRAGTRRTRPNTGALTLELTLRTGVVWMSVWKISKKSKGKIHKNIGSDRTAKNESK